MPRPVSTFVFAAHRLTEVREETGLSVKTLASHISLDWRVVSLWESSPAPGSPMADLAHEPTASQLMGLARVLDADPLDFFKSLEDADASEKEEERASKAASGIRLDGRRLATMRKVKGLSFPQAAVRARVSQDEVRRAEEGRTINTGALLRLLQVYEPRRDPVELLATVIVTEKAPRRRR